MELMHFFLQKIYIKTNKQTNKNKQKILIQWWGDRMKIIIESHKVITKTFHKLHKNGDKKFSMY